AQSLAVTDEAMAMERAGAQPLLVEGADDNLKITTPSDLALAEFLLSRG
ncbi:MAG: 2-C-methyl-D-erythritol 4-phosphate cytidylyltransferase, partial [Aquimonas sp.]